MHILGKFGIMTIMVTGTASHLRGKTPGQLVELKEEGMEFGWYFIVRGIERNHAAVCV